MSSSAHDPYVRVRGAREHNLRHIDVDIPRDVLAVFTGVSGSGKSSLAFGTIYAEAQRRYFESVAPYARRLIHQVGAPAVDDILGLPPAVALEQRRGSATSRSYVGTVTTLSNTLRMLFSRAGTYPPGAEPVDSDAFSPNTAAGACPVCHGLGRVHHTTEELMVPDPSLSIREGAVAAWPGAWHGKNLRDVTRTLGHDIDRPWRELPQQDGDWILFTDEQPVVTVHPVREAGALPGHVPERPALCDAHLRRLQEPGAARPCRTVPGELALSGLRRQPAAAGVTGRHLRRPHHRAAQRHVAHRSRRGAAAFRPRRGGGSPRRSPPTWSPGSR